MSDFQHKEGHGALFKNNYKEKDAHPDMKGDATYKGAPVELAAWTKVDKNGNKYLSIKIQDKQEQYSKGVDQARQAATNGDDKWDVPFSNYELRTLV